MKMNNPKELVFKQDYSTAAQRRVDSKNQQPKLLWFTGLSGSGKSTLAEAFELELLQQSFHTYVLDGDNVRLGLNAGLGFDSAGREENLRRIAEVSKLMLEAGLIVIAAFVSPTIAQRERVKQIVGAPNFIEVYVNTPLEECERRDVKGLYKKARAGEIPNFTGISALYEAPLSPDVAIKTENRSINDCVIELRDQLIPMINNG
jgi:adenylyl-sulfate kinase